MKRKCEVCPAEVMAVCRHVFGKYWADKSRNGEGCNHPIDDVADAWYAKGWTPDEGEAEHVVLSITLPHPSRPTMPRRPVRPTASKIQSGMPTRPKVSAEIMRQADRFFGTKK